MTSTIHTGTERAERSEASEAPPPYTDISANMNVNIELHTTHGCRASRAKRGERGAPPLHRHKYEQEIETLSVRALCWDNFVFLFLFTETNLLTIAFFYLYVYMCLCLWFFVSFIFSFCLFFCFVYNTKLMIIILAYNLFITQVHIQNTLAYNQIIILAYDFS